MKNKKLSSAQVNVLELMYNGWELGFYGGINLSITLQENGLGRGGSTKSIAINTFNILIRYKSIESNPDQPNYGRPEKYRLTESAKNLFKEDIS